MPARPHLDLQLLSPGVPVLRAGAGAEGTQLPGSRQSYSDMMQGQSQETWVRSRSLQLTPGAVSALSESRGHQ